MTLRQAPCIEFPTSNADKAEKNLRLPRHFLDIRGPGLYNTRVVWGGGDVTILPFEAENVFALHLQGGKRQRRRDRLRQV